MKRNDRCVLTGCDSKTEWQLPWFIENLRKNCTADLVIADFGMSDEMLTFASSSCNIIIEMNKDNSRKGWMLKPKAMASSPYKYSVWIDTDCHVKENIDDIFDLIVPNKLLMVEDRPWSKRRLEKWHNSGVVGFKNTPPVLIEWAKMCEQKTDIEGDQEVLHWMMGGEELRRLSFIEDLPHKFNTLRLDLIDNIAPKKISVMHWTGQKGNDEIRKMIKDA